MINPFIDTLKSPPEQYSPVVLAYVGDAVFELYVRSFLVAKGNLPVHELHKRSIGYVKAAAQSAALALIEPVLTELELGIYKRGRNSKASTVPKNADAVEYRRATGFETLLGYLYLKGQHQRLYELIQVVLKQNT